MNRDTHVLSVDCGQRILIVTDTEIFEIQAVPPGVGGAKPPERPPIRRSLAQDPARLQMIAVVDAGIVNLRAAAVNGSLGEFPFVHPEGARVLFELTD